MKLGGGILVRAAGVERSPKGARNAFFTLKANQAILYIICPYGMKDQRVIAHCGGDQWGGSGRGA
jgi:hypothetical protein